MKYILDSHTHTLASGHAYNTIREMAMTASEKGLELLGITEHAPRIPGTCHSFYFMNLKVVDRQMCGVELLLGAELNILDFNGSVDLDDNILRQMDINIASMHPPCMPSGSVEENTEGYINAMKNPYVDIIGHPDDGRFPVDYLALVQAAKEFGVLLEINNSSLSPIGYRENSAENTLCMLEHCKDYQVPVIVGSDAHQAPDVGRHDYAEAILKQADFPEHLILNGSADAFKPYVNRYKNSGL